MTFSKFVLAATVCLSAVSCSTPQGDHLEVKKYVLDHAKRIDAADPAIRFEQRYRLHGCVSAEDMKSKNGYYYTARWSLADATQPAVMRLEYRQSKTGSQIIKKEIEVTGSEGVYEFSVIGEEAAKNPVTSWKVSLSRGKTELSTFKSYMWE